MEYGYKKIFWGFIFTFLDINLGTFDILPNFLGYYFIYLGCVKLAEEDEYFSKACTPAMFLIGMEVILLINKVFMQDPLRIYGGFSMMGTIIGLATRVVGIVLLYYVIKGIYNVSERNNNKDMMKKSKFIWNMLFGLFVIEEFITPFYINTNFKFLSVILVITVLVNLVINIKLLILIKRSSKEFVV